MDQFSNLDINARDSFYLVKSSLQNFFLNKPEFFEDTYLFWRSLYVAIYFFEILLPLKKG